MVSCLANEFINGYLCHVLSQLHEKCDHIKQVLLAQLM